MTSRNEQQTVDSDRIDGLDALRGGAVLLVVACHAGVPGLAVGGGTAGVTVFFVLSGYLITRILLKGERTSSFYLRRAARLLPALLLMLATVGLFHAAADLDAHGFLISAAFTLSYVANWVPLSELGPLLHTWSLSVEEQFYVAWPLLVLIFPRRRLPLVLVTIVLASLVIRGLVSHPHAIRGTDTNAYAIAAGGFIATVKTPHAPRWFVGVGVALIAVAAAGPKDFDHNFLWGVDFRWSPPLAAAGALLVLWAVTAQSLRTPRWLRHIADVSYGWYLWHLPLMLAFPLGLAGRLVAACLALVCAEASLRWVERPVRNWARRHTRPGPGDERPDDQDRLAPRDEVSSASVT